MIKLKDLLEGTCGYGENGELGEEPAGPHLIKKVREKKNPRIPRKKGQPRGSKKHSDLYTDENPKGTIHGLKFATVKDARASVSKIKNSGKAHAHKIQAAIAMEQRARAAGKTSQAAVYRAYINKMKKKTKKRNEVVLPEGIECLCERCWKGYTQKGMKKMFGKMYPNCVKIKKKKKRKSENVKVNHDGKAAPYGSGYEKVEEKKWSDKYKKSIDCSNPKGFSQKAHCAGRKKRK
jgi:hypothetical protein|tara:strand:- start:87 stop:791 length:705 start_codon:yes stop_codon:yes gene_type:complete